MAEIEVSFQKFNCFVISNYKFCTQDHLLNLVILKYMRSASVSKFKYLTCDLIEGHFLLCCKQTIGQAYEGMQTQNQRILQQIIECDDYNEQVK